MQHLLPIQLSTQYYIDISKKLNCCVYRVYYNLHAAYVGVGLDVRGAIAALGQKGGGVLGE